LEQILLQLSANLLNHFNKNKAVKVLLDQARNPMMTTMMCLTWLKVLMMPRNKIKYPCLE
jgi:hypothetical protein